MSYVHNLDFINYGKGMSVRGLNNTADSIVWEIIENALPIDSLTKDQEETLRFTYGESWRGLINDLLSTSII